jgi:hypothetical protein
MFGSSSRALICKMGPLEPHVWLVVKPKFAFVVQSAGVMSATIRPPLKTHTLAFDTLSSKRNPRQLGDQPRR